MNKTKIRKDANGNIIDKSNKNYHITITENFVTIKEVESYKKYNVLNDDNDNDDDDEQENRVPFIQNYRIQKFEKPKNRDPNSISNGKCIVI